MNEAKESYGATKNNDVESGGEVLPAYDEAANAAPPPTYDSLYGRIKNARENTDSHTTFLKKVCFLLFNTVGFLVVMAVFLALPVAMIVVGALNLDHCTIQRFIPIWLLVSGVSFAIQQLGNLYDRAKEKCSGKTEKEIEEETSTVWKSFNGCLGCFNFAWFICGNVWVYGSHSSVTYLVGSAYYCDKTTYMFSFWVITLTYIVMAFMCFCTCCIALCVPKKK